MDNEIRYEPKFVNPFLYTFTLEILICVFVFAVWPKIQYPIAFLGVWSQICTISIDSKHWVFFSDTFHEVWHIYFWNLVRFWSWYWNSCRFKSCEFADKNFNIRTFGDVFKYYELAVYLRMTLILLHNFYSTIWGLQFSDLWENRQKKPRIQIQIMAYSMKLGINTMNCMFYGKNDSFLVFFTISDFSLRTTRV